MAVAGIGPPGFIDPLGNLDWASAQNGMTAKASGTQSNGTLITSNFARFTTVATAADSALLPPAQPGLAVTVVNSGAASMQLFGSGTDTINDIATATGVPQLKNSCVIYSCPVAGKWYSTPISGFASTGLPLASASANNLGGTQTSATGATAITTSIYGTSTQSTQSSSSFILPAAVAGMGIRFFNAGSQTCNVYAALTTDAIQAKGAAGTTFITVPTSAAVEFFSQANTSWAVLSSS